MSTPRKLRRVMLLSFLTLAGLLGAAEMGLLRVPSLHASETCANGACDGIYCRYRPGYSCSFPDRNSCTTTRCAFAIE
jgi:hypothetical protein